MTWLPNAEMKLKSMALIATNPRSVRIQIEEFKVTNFADHLTVIIDWFLPAWYFPLLLLLSLSNWPYFQVLLKTVWISQKELPENNWTSF